MSCHSFIDWIVMSIEYLFGLSWNQASGVCQLKERIRTTSSYIRDQRTFQSSLKHFLWFWGVIQVLYKTISHAVFNLWPLSLLLSIRRWILDSFLMYWRISTKISVTIPISPKSSVITNCVKMFLKYRFCTSSEGFHIFRVMESFCLYLSFSYLPMPILTYPIDSL